MAGTWDFGNLRFWKNVRVPFLKNPQKELVLKMPPLPGSKIPLLAIHKIISHIWEDRSRKVNNDEPDLRFFHGNFWPVISRTVWKPCFSASIPRGPNLCILGPRPSLGPPTWISRRRRRRRRRTNSQIQIQAPPNAPRDEMLPRRESSLLIYKKAYTAIQTESFNDDLSDVVFVPNKLRTMGVGLGLVRTC